MKDTHNMIMDIRHNYLSHAGDYRPFFQYAGDLILDPDLNDKGIIGYYFSTLSNLVM